MGIAVRSNILKAFILLRYTEISKSWSQFVHSNNETVKLIRTLKKIKQRILISIIRRQCKGELSKELSADIQRWPCQSIEEAFLNYPEFRTLFFYRVGNCGLSGRILARLLPDLPTLYITTPTIGPGLFIQHGFSTIISAKQIGKNCWICQQVTIGYTNATDCPTIGDDVTINAGAIVIGNVHIGDRAKIGAGAVVVKSVPADCTVVGNPARIVRRNGVRVREDL